MQETHLDTSSHTWRERVVLVARDCLSLGSLAAEIEKRNMGKRCIWEVLPRDRRRETEGGKVNLRACH